MHLPFPVGSSCRTPGQVGLETASWFSWKALLGCYHLVGSSSPLLCLIPLTLTFAANLAQTESHSWPSMDEEVRSSGCNPWREQRLVTSLVLLILAFLGCADREPPRQGV